MQKRINYLEASVERMADADKRRQDEMAQWQGDIYTPEDIERFRRQQGITQALTDGFATLGCTPIRL